MGVMSCSRNGCENIMCSRYSDEFGYICYECFQELKDKQECDHSLSLKKIKKFMEKPKTIFNSEKIKPEIVLEEVFEEVC